MYFAFLVVKSYLNYLRSQANHIYTFRRKANRRLKQIKKLVLNLAFECSVCCLFVHIFDRNACLSSINK